MNKENNLEKGSCESIRHLPPKYIRDKIKLGKIFKHKCPDCGKTTYLSKPLYTIEL